METEKLASKRILGYAIGAIPLVLLAGFFNLAYVNFFYDDLKLNEVYWILGLIIYAVVNSINDPIIGHLSDNTDVKKWGSRRIVYIKYCSPILALNFVLIWFPWSLDNQIIIFLQFVVMICAYETLLTTVVLTWYALLPDMTDNIDERTKIGFLSGIIGFFAALPIMIIPYIMNSRELLQIGSIVVAGVSIICYALVVKWSKERPEFQHDKSPPLVDALKQTLKSKSFIYFMGYNFAKNLQLSVGVSYLFVHALILGENGILYFFLIYVLIGYGANIFCMKLRPKYGIKKIMKTFMPLQIIGGIVSFFLILNSVTEWFLWIGVIWVSFFGGCGVFSPAIQALPIDEDEVKYGSRREGMFYGINALFTMHANSLGPIIATLILSATNYVKNGPFEVQPATAILGIKFLFFFIPQIFTLAALVFIILYPLDGEKLATLEKELEALHEKKRKTFLSDSAQNE